MKVIPAVLVDGVVNCPDNVELINGAMVKKPVIGKLFNGAEWLLFEPGDQLPDTPDKWDQVVPAHLQSKITKGK